MNYRKCMHDLFHYHYTQGNLEEVEEFLRVAA